MPPKNYHLLNQNNWVVEFKIPDYTHKEPYEPIGEMVAMSLDDAFGLLENTKIESESGLVVGLCRAIVKNPDYNPSVQQSGKLDIKPITKSKLSNMNKDTLQEAYNKSLVKNSVYVKTEVYALNVNKDKDNFDTETNRNVIKGVFEKYNGEFYGIEIV